MKKSLFLLIICFVVGSCLYLNSNSNEEYINPYKNINKASLIEGLKSIKISEEKFHNNENNIYINARIPTINYKDINVQKYINNLIKNDINQFNSMQKQQYTNMQKKEKIYIDINYHILFEDADVLNIVILKKVGSTKNTYSLYKDSYLFDLNTGQRISLEEFLKGNNNYKEIIKKNILSYINKNKLPYDKNRIIIDDNTSYYLLDDGIVVYFNPYQDSKEKIDYQFKIPYESFKNKIRKVQTDKVSAQIINKTIIDKKDNLDLFLNVPSIKIKNKEIENSVNKKLNDISMNFYKEVKKLSKVYDSQIKYIASQTYKVKNNKNDLLSLYLEFSQLASGAHADTYGMGYNVDLSNGEEITLKKLFEDNIDYISIINENILKQIKELPDKDVYEFKSINTNQKFYIDGDNLVIFFDLYEIAPYPAGIPEFKIPIEKIKNNINENYINRL